MIADTNVKARVTRGGWILLALGIASLALVPARAEQELDPLSDVVEEQPDSEKSDATEPATAKPVNTNQISKPEAVELANLREVIRMTPVFSGNCHPGDQIGSLILSGYWKKILPLNKAQTRAILELEDLLQESRELSWYADADHPADDLASYQAFLARSRLRREEAIYHAQRVVSLGLLTEAQAAFVLQHVLSSRKWKALYSLNVQNLLGISEEQKEELLKVGKEAQDYYTLEPEKRPAVMQRLNAAYMDVLTPSQKEMWSRLTAEQSLPAEPPKLSALTAADAERVKLEDLSPTFRALSDNPRYNFGVTAYQKRLLDDLAEVTREGVYWISLRVPKEQLPPAKDRREQDDRTSQTTARFVKHAEQVALLGILTEGQAERVRAAIQEKN